MEGFEHWYDNFYLAYGIQKIKNSKDSDTKLNRRVFYINKIKLEEAENTLRQKLKELEVEEKNMAKKLSDNYGKGSNSADDPYGSFSFQNMTGVLSASTTYTYNVQFKNNQGSNSARLSGDGNSLRTLTLMEIAG